jgi:hypothetical protein
VLDFFILEYYSRISLKSTVLWDPDLPWDNLQAAKKKLSENKRQADLGGKFCRGCYGPIRDQPAPDRQHQGQAFYKKSKE